MSTLNAQATFELGFMVKSCNGRKKSIAAESWLESNAVSPTGTLLMLPSLEVKVTFAVQTPRVNSAFQWSRNSTLENLHPTNSCGQF